MANDKSKYEVEEVSCDYVSEHAIARGRPRGFWSAFRDGRWRAVGGGSLRAIRVGACRAASSYGMTGQCRELDDGRIAVRFVPRDRVAGWDD